MALPDNTLVSEILAGDKDQYVVLMQRYERRVFNLMYRYCGSYDESSELTRDVFCKAYAKLSTYRDKAGFFAWLYTLAMNHARDWKRKSRNNTAKLQAYSREQEVHAQSSSLPAGNDEDSQQLIEALATLPEDRRELLILRYRHDCSIRELAEIFNLSESGVKMRLQRALETLRNKLATK